MKIFATRGRRVTAAGPEARSLSAGQRLGLPHRLEGVGEALASGSDGCDACAVAGQELARDGGSMQEALDALRTTWRIVMGTDPSYESVVALLTAWSETTLGYLHQLSCEDPLTGLASQAHLRTRLSELYRADLADLAAVAHGGRHHALVMCSVPAGDDPSDGQDDHFTRAMRMTRMGEMARTVFSRNETIARLGTRSVAVLVPRDERLGRRVRVLRTLLGGLEADGAPARVWIEGLPGSDSGAAMLLDELARG